MIARLSDPDEIQIHHAIVHKVDHKNFKNPILADLETGINDEIGGFLKKHIQKNRLHKNASTGKFKSPIDGSQSVHLLCNEMLDDPECFIDRSQLIAKHLFNVQPGNASPGDLVILVFSDVKHDSNKWVALLKMDPESGFVGEREEVNGKIRINLRHVPEVLPTSELQKCAFVLPLSQREEAGYELIVLDHIKSKRGDYTQTVATFFLDKFLNCIKYPNAYELTHRFVLHVYDWVDKKKTEGEIDQKTAQNIRMGVLNEIEKNSVDIPGFAIQHIENNIEQDNFIDSAREKLGNLVFQPDKKVRKKYDFETWIGDYGIEIKIPVDRQENSSIIERVFSEETNTNIITIRTTKWQQKR